MNPIKLERSATLMYDCRQDTSLLTVGSLTLDALTVYQSPTKALELANWWQRIREIEVAYDNHDAGYIEHGEEIRDLGWEIHAAHLLNTTPQYGYINFDDEDIKYDDELLMEALQQCRRAILEAIYVEVKDANL